MDFEVIMRAAVSSGNIGLLVCYLCNRFIFEYEELSIPIMYKAEGGVQLMMERAAHWRCYEEHQDVEGLR